MEGGLAPEVGSFRQVIQIKKRRIFFLKRLLLVRIDKELGLVGGLGKLSLFLEANFFFCVLASEVYWMVNIGIELFERMVGGELQLISLQHSLEVLLYFFCVSVAMEALAYGWAGAVETETSTTGQELLARYGAIIFATNEGEEVGSRDVDILREIEAWRLRFPRVGASNQRLQVAQSRLLTHSSLQLFVAIYQLLLGHGVQGLILFDVEAQDLVDVNELCFIVIFGVDSFLCYDLFHFEDPVFYRAVAIGVQVAEDLAGAALLHVVLQEGLSVLGVRLEAPLLLRDHAVRVEEEFLQVEVDHRLL